MNPRLKISWYICVLAIVFFIKGKNLWYAAGINDSATVDLHSFYLCNSYTPFSLRDLIALGIDETTDIKSSLSTCWLSSVGYQKKSDDDFQSMVDENAHQMFIVGMSYLIEGRRDVAITYWQRYPAIGNMFFNLGGVYQRSGQSGLSKKAFEMASLIDDNNPLFWEKVGTIRWNSGDKEGAREAYTKSLALITSDRPHYYWITGGIKWLDQDWKGAIEEYIKGIYAEPERADYYVPNICELVSRKIESGLEERQYINMTMDALHSVGVTKRYICLTK